MELVYFLSICNVTKMSAMALITVNIQYVHVYI